MIWLLTVLAIALNVVVLRDIFQTLFTPTGTGALSARLAAAVWKLFHLFSRTHPNRLSIAGPVIMVLTILLWTLGLTVGWALFIWPRLPDDFLLSSGMSLAENRSIWDAIYLSLVSLTTLGFGDITPRTTVLRLLLPLEALIGFALFTAAISWIMSTYPPLARRRRLARTVNFLDEAERSAGMPADELSPPVYAGILHDLARELFALRNDLVQHTVIYYFRSAERSSALDLALPALYARARAATRDDRHDVRFQAFLLCEALDDLARFLASSPLSLPDDADTEAILAAYREDQRHELSQDQARTPLL